MKILKFLYKKILFLIRFAFFFALNLSWPIIRRFYKCHYLFVVYPGTEKDYKGYYPKWLDRVLPLVFPIGFISKGDIGKRGLVLATPTTTKEFYNVDRMKLVLKKIMVFYDVTNSGSIALAGQFPGIMSRNGIGIKPPIVQGNLGTVFVLIQTLEAVIKRHELSPREINLGILGIGYIGESLINFLANSFAKVVGVDKSIKRIEKLNLSDKKDIILSTNPIDLSECDIVVILTSKGDDAQNVFPYFKNNVIIVDDTHPPLSAKNIEFLKREKKAVVYKAAVGLSGVRFFPRLPNYSPEWIPGCAIEALVALFNGFNFKSQEEFNRSAQELGFYPHLVYHMKEVL